MLRNVCRAWNTTCRVPWNHLSFQLCLCVAIQSVYMPAVSPASALPFTAYTALHARSRVSSSELLWYKVGRTKYAVATVLAHVAAKGWLKGSMLTCTCPASDANRFRSQIRSHQGPTRRSGAGLGHCAYIWRRMGPKFRQHFAIPPRLATLPPASSH
jgi:hypothetical protein